MDHLLFAACRLFIFVTVAKQKGPPLAGSASALVRRLLFPRTTGTSVSQPDQLASMNASTATAPPASIQQTTDCNAVDQGGDEGRPCVADRRKDACAAPYYNHAPRQARATYSAEALQAAAAGQGTQEQEDVLPLGNRSTLFFFSGSTRDDVPWYRCAVRFCCTDDGNMDIQFCRACVPSIQVATSCHLHDSNRYDACTAAASARRW